MRHGNGRESPRTLGARTLAGMDTSALLQALALHGEVLASAFDGLSEDEARYRPAPERWSALEILGHLVDEEHGDFRVRLGLTLEDPRAPWPRIDPQGWVRERKHQQRAPTELLAEFCEERRRSLLWLHDLRQPAWHHTHVHPELGELRAGDLLAAWAAHDVLHLRQLADTRLAFLRQVASPYSSAYAGA